MRKKVIKIIHRAIRPNQDGKWLVWCQVYINGNYRYDCLELDTYEEAREISEGKIIDENNYD